MLFGPSFIGTFASFLTHVFTFLLRLLLQLSFVVTFVKFCGFFLCYLFPFPIFLFHTFLAELFIPFVISIVQELVPHLSFFLRFLFGVEVFFLPTFGYVFTSFDLTLVIVSI